jgi:hypothetical protein
MRWNSTVESGRPHSKMVMLALGQSRSECYRLCAQHRAPAVLLPCSGPGIGDPCPRERTYEAMWMADRPRATTLQVVVKHQRPEVLEPA